MQKHYQRKLYKLNCDLYFIKISISLKIMLRRYICSEDTLIISTDMKNEEELSIANIKLSFNAMNKHLLTSINLTQILKAK